MIFAENTLLKIRSHLHIERHNWQPWKPWKHSWKVSEMERELSDDLAAQRPQWKLPRFPWQDDRTSKNSLAWPAWPASPRCVKSPLVDLKDGQKAALQSFDRELLWPVNVFSKLLQIAPMPNVRLKCPVRLSECKQPTLWCHQNIAATVQGNDDDDEADNDRQSLSSWILCNPPQSF